MALKPETRFRIKVAEDLRSVPTCKFFSIQQTSIIGTPDILACINGHFVAIEIKASDDAKVSALQKYNLKEIEKMNGIALIVHPENWKFLLKRLQMLGCGEKLPQEVLTVGFLT